MHFKIRHPRESLVQAGMTRREPWYQLLIGARVLPAVGGEDGDFHGRHTGRCEVSNQPRDWRAEAAGLTEIGHTSLKDSMRSVKIFGDSVIKSDEISQNTFF